MRSGPRRPGRWDSPPPIHSFLGVGEVRSAGQLRASLHDGASVATLPKRRRLVKTTQANPPVLAVGDGFIVGSKFMIASVAAT